jgi:hypothetical protein
MRASHARTGRDDLEKSSTLLHLWFYAMYLMTSTRCGISAKQLERELGVTYKTAWRMAHLIRHKLMTQDSEPFDSGNPVEIDETYVGGRGRNPRRGSPGADTPLKVPVLGSVQRSGRVAAITSPFRMFSVRLSIRTSRSACCLSPWSIPTSTGCTVYDMLGGEGSKHSRIQQLKRST